MKTSIAFTSIAIVTQMALAVPMSDFKCQASDPPGYFDDGYNCVWYTCRQGNAIPWITCVGEYCVLQGGAPACGLRHTFGATLESNGTTH